MDTQHTDRDGGVMDDGAMDGGRGYANAPADGGNGLTGGGNSHAANAPADGGYFFPVLSPEELRQVSTLGLAHMGDGVFELLVRSWLCVHGKATGREMHRACVALVRAESQAEKAARIVTLLDEEEWAVYRRGRNAQPHSVPAHATRAQYAAATALEALLGWLYLRGRRERIEELFAVMMEGEA